MSADGSIASSRSVAHGVRRLDRSGCVNGPAHPEQYTCHTLTLMSSTEIISLSVHRTIVLVGYGTGTVLGTNGLRYEYVSLYTSVHVFSRFSIENVLLSVALRTGTPHYVLYS